MALHRALSPASLPFGDCGVHDDHSLDLRRLNPMNSTLGSPDLLPRDPAGTPF